MSPGRTPLVRYAHGGGWSRGTRSDDSATRLAPLAAHSLTVVSGDYRAAPEAAFPQPLHDLKGAVRWLRARGPELGLPTTRIGVGGASAGADPTSLLALSEGDSDLEGTVGATDPDELAERARGLSLLTRVSAQAPPFLITHGDRDRIVPPSEGLALHQALGRAGARSRFELLAGAGHEDPEFDSPATLATTAARLRAVPDPAP
ncbi:alpha/beta hydrolase [Amycolatopsis thermophila]|uniref:Acetyl esterase/lipase n=1 Tax=Amycolatopsis thermophila TaxID=206084 RepID=A0ABU0F2J8_9PSEU|nr:alpha/beta hydrolase [Amycolatopsis thermophila]MDQ0381564.1 acetyl esterase/lipase [Amycolatopsis thermophila]